MKQERRLLEKYSVAAFEAVLLTLQNSVVTICTTRFHSQKFYIQPTQYVFVFSMDLRTNSDYLPMQH